MERKKIKHVLSSVGRTSRPSCEIDGNGDEEDDQEEGPVSPEARDPARDPPTPGERFSDFRAHRIT